MIRKTLVRGSAVLVTAATAFTLATVPASAEPIIGKGVVPNPSPSLPKGLSGKLDSLLGMFMAVVIVACVAGVFMAAWKLAIAYRNHEMGEAAGKLGGVAAACILVGGASGIVTFLYA